MAAALTIGFVPGVSPAKWVRTWRERFPEHELALQPVAASDVVHALGNTVDIAFGRLPVPDRLNAIPLWTETPVVAMPKDSVFTAADTLMVADLAGATILADALGAVGAPVATIPDDLSGLLDLVEAGAGLAVIPQSLFRAASRRSLVSRPIEGIPPTQVALIWRTEDHSALIDAFIGIVRGRTANSSRGPSPDASEREARAASTKRGASGSRSGSPAQRTGGGGTGRRTGRGAKGSGRPRRSR
ncbi:LysR family substrate-binding domain-containing protein [Curtobacterium ammoniigenes]|uniref:LysR family substrate-binding domain-containing protein n=1 Tax=Curtobacterium ammoniigenes TaxID=395387 RepID=UPI001470374F|nr:LysR family substrate-binding domain-containing protein [Curtobacterium ammoniigenes]